MDQNPVYLGSFYLGIREACCKWHSLRQRMGEVHRCGLRVKPQLHRLGEVAAVRSLGLHLDSPGKVCGS